MSNPSTQQRHAYDVLVVRVMNQFRVVLLVYEDLCYFQDRARHVEEVQDLPVLERLRSTIVQIEHRLVRKYDELQSLRAQMAQAKGWRMIEFPDRGVLRPLQKHLINATLFYSHLDDNLLFDYFIIWRREHPIQDYLKGFLRAHPDLFHPLFRAR